MLTARPKYFYASWALLPPAWSPDSGSLPNCVMSGDRLAAMTDLLLQTPCLEHVIYLRGQNIFLHPLLPEVTSWLLSRGAWVDLEGNARLEPAFYENLRSGLPCNRFRVTLTVNPTLCDLREIALRSGQLAEAGISLRIRLLPCPEDPARTETFLNSFRRLREVIPFAFSFPENGAAPGHEPEPSALTPLHQGAGAPLQASFPDPVPCNNVELGFKRFCCPGLTALNIDPPGRCRGSFCARAPQLGYLWEADKISPQIISCDEKDCPDRDNSILPKFASHAEALQWLKQDAGESRVAKNAAIPSQKAATQQRRLASRVIHADCSIVIAARSANGISTLNSALLPGGFSSEIIFLYDNPALTDAVCNIQTGNPGGIRPVFLPGRRPLGAMLNLGLKMATGRYVAFAADGDIIETAALGQTIEQLACKNAAAATYALAPAVASADDFTIDASLTDYGGLYERASLVENGIEFGESDSFFSGPFRLRLSGAGLATLHLDRPPIHMATRPVEENWLQDFAAFIAWPAEESNQQYLQAKSHSGYMAALFRQYREEIFRAAPNRQPPAVYANLASNSEFLNALLKDYSLICRANKPPLAAPQSLAESDPLPPRPGLAGTAPLLTVILRNCAYLPETERSLASIRNQPCPELELIIAGKSKPALIRDIMQGAFSSGHDIRILTAESLSEALGLVSGKYVVFAESGGVFTPGF
ncbi:MAG: hypothetical protein HDQ91_01290, partial [Desulfovibrio sp.]|nr:hypothetical protein [Desulfovibrio sp.]